MCCPAGAAGVLPVAGDPLGAAVGADVWASFTGAGRAADVAGVVGGPGGVWAAAEAASATRLKPESKP